MAIHEAQLRLDLPGPSQVCLVDRSPTFPTRKTLALLIYLAPEDGQQPRELLAALLRPESDQDLSYASLRNTLGHLRSALSEARELAQGSYLSITHSALALNPGADILVDLKMVERAYAQARTDRSSRSTPEDAVSPLLQQAASYHRSDFLTGGYWTMHLASTIAWRGTLLRAAIEWCTTPSSRPSARCSRRKTRQSTCSGEGTAGSLELSAA